MISADEYLFILKNLNLSETDIAMLRAQYNMPERTCTAAALADALGYKNWTMANLFYGKLGHRVAEIIDPRSERLEERDRYEENGRPVYLSYLSSWEDTPRGILWIMRPNLATALETLGIVNYFADEIEGSPSYWEGAVKTIRVNTYERSAQARKRCIQYHGSACMVCGFNFAAVYGEIGEGYIHVHHTKPLSETAETYEVDPITDLQPVCPNCHAMLHRKVPPYKIEELKAILKRCPQ